MLRNYPLVALIVWTLGCLKASLGQPAEYERLRRAFNMEVLRVALPGLVDHTVQTPWNDVNERLAMRVQRAVTDRISLIYGTEFAVAVWDLDIPQVYRPKFAHNIGIKPYVQCVVPPRFIERGCGPCGEGGAVNYISTNPRKALMIIYTPVAYNAYNSLQTGRIRMAYMLAIEACLQWDWPDAPTDRLDLLLLANCISNNLDQDQGYTKARGVAVIPAGPPHGQMDPAVKPPGFSSPGGHVLRDPQKIVRSDTGEVLFPNLPEEHAELWIFIGAPLYTPYA